MKENWYDHLIVAPIWYDMFFGWREYEKNLREMVIFFVRVF
jgi:hypothetical protein